MVGVSIQLKMKTKKERELEYKRNLEIKTRQIFLGLIYVFTVVLGSLARMPESYWSSRSNIINKLFVKVGWFWTTIVFIIYAIRVIHNNKLEQIKSIVRWGFATLYWYIFTQWFFGPSVMDRVFVITGGVCSNKTSETFEAHVCRRGGGDWNNGHDVSGHCFLLIHASLFMLEEASVLFHRSNNWSETMKNKILNWFFVGLLLLWWWMLLMTAVYFHTLWEKFTGTLLGILYWGLMYGFIFPKYMPCMMPYDSDELEKN
ncbi:6206_t:CDS:1 [Funneliformis geosporum]|uniref:8957_t:CDS:1 n=1 Tax=Funneliformis geosporum TaxID=1117311 RepID=A0A9W4SWY3_9GLOM|nr:6206_t:CDS:1 [Funneliformis geosporum]CAI2183717.1 8957_t:CDS:1 [Funneliformis geosporum]